LMSRVQGGPAPAAKKKISLEDKPVLKPPALPTRPEEEEWALGSAASGSKAPALPTNLAESWPEVLAMMTGKLGNGTASLLSGSTPRELKDNTLTIEFPAGARIQKQMCEGNGRAEQIAAVLSEHLGTSVRI
jgi:hypothetical protein